MKKEIKTIADLEIGTIFKCSWWGMSDFYEVIGKTDKSVKLAELKWETGLGPNGEVEEDPTYRWCHIVRDANGKAVRDTDFNGKPKIFTKRVIQLEDGGIAVRSPNYDGHATVQITDSDYDCMYWG